MYHLSESKIKIYDFTINKKLDFPRLIYITGPCNDQFLKSWLNVSFNFFG